MSSSTELFLGVDGGQSSTKALIGDATGRVLGRGTAGPCNHVSSDEARAKFSRVIKECVSAACLNAGIAPSVRFRGACFGMSGGPVDKDALLRQAVNAEHWLVTHDGLIALSGALAGQNGIVAIAGTGSFVFGRRDDRMMRSGGWGYIFGDEGSAFWIVRESLRAALRQEEGWGPPTALSALLLEATGAKTANEVLHLFYTAEWPRSRVARLAADVAKVCDAGDEVASWILLWAGERLAMAVGTVRETLWGPSEKDEVTASFVGGVFQSASVLSNFRDRLRTGWNVEVKPPVWGADAGALIEAYRLAGIQPALAL